MRTIRLDTFQGIARVLGRDCPVALGAGVLGIHALRQRQVENVGQVEEPDPEFAMRILEALDAPQVPDTGGLAAPVATIQRCAGEWIFEATEFAGEPGPLVVRAASPNALFAALAARYSPKDSAVAVVQVNALQEALGPQTSSKAESVPAPAPSAADQPAPAPPPARRPRKPPIPLAAPAPAPIIPTEPPAPPPPPEARPPAPRPAPPALHFVAPLDEEDADPDSAGGCPNDADGPVADLIPVPELLARANKLRDVVSFLMDRGRVTAEQIEGACVALKALTPCPVPVLDRVPAENLHDRLGNVFTILNIGQAS